MHNMWLSRSFSPSKQQIVVSRSQFASPSMGAGYARDCRDGGTPRSRPHGAACASGNIPNCGLLSKPMMTASTISMYSVPLWCSWRPAQPPDIWTHREQWWSRSGHHRCTLGTSIERSSQWCQWRALSPTLETGDFHTSYTADSTANNNSHAS